MRSRNNEVSCLLTFSWVVIGRVAAGTNPSTACGARTVTVS